MEDFGRDMYKLYKMFNNKAKQVMREREKEAGPGGIKRDSVRGQETLEEQFAPVRLSSLVQNSIKQFKV